MLHFSGSPEAVGHRRLKRLRILIAGLAATTHGLGIRTQIREFRDPSHEKLPRYDF
jgi:hypothetical protein